MNELLDFAGKYKFLSYASCLLSGLSALIAILPFWYIWNITSCIIFSVNEEYISFYAWQAVIYSVVSMFVYIAGLLCSHMAAFRIAANIRIKLLNHVSSLPLGFIEIIGTGKLRRIIIDTSASSENYIAHIMPDSYSALFSSIGLACLLFWSDWRLALVSIAPITLGLIIMAMMTGNNMRKKIAEYNSALNLMSNEAVEYVRGIPVVKTFGQSIFSFRRFVEAVSNYESWTVSYTNELRVPMTCYTVAVNSAFLFLIAAGVGISRSGVSHEFMKNFMLAVITAPLISVRLTRTLRLRENQMTSQDALRRINEILSLKPLSIREDSLRPEREADVDIQSISFSYGKNIALSNVTLNLKHGQTLALVGHSGGGKSTLAKLIARFFDVNKGRISISNINIQDMSTEDLMNQIAIVFQDSKLIKGSILDNVRMSRPEASRDEVIHALETAQCTDIIAKLPDGIDSIIGSEGVYLSGGETQRICIARALLKNAPVIILDEAAAYSDPDNEKRIHESLKALAHNKTVIMIAHRLSGIRNSDVIAVLDNGKLIESGSCDELIQNGGTFSRMWNEYQSSLSWNISKEGR